MSSKTKRKMSKCKDFLLRNVKMKGLVMFIIINLLYVTVASYLVTAKKISYEQISKGFIPLLIVNSVVGVIICAKKYYKKNVTHIFIALIIFFGVISTIFAINPKVALYGFKGRYEGLITIMYYFSLAFLCGFIRKKYRKIIIWFILLCGVIQCIYAICQIQEVPRCI